MPRRVRCLLLCEDLEQEQFFRPILEKLLKGPVRVEPRLPNGGIAFVLKQLPRCSKVLKRFPSETRGLVVVVDGDDDGLEGRLKAVDAVLKESGLTPRSAERRLSVCVPSRTIETWDLWFLGTRDVDEKTDYKPLFRNRWRDDSNASRRASEAWFEPVDGAAEAERLPALVHARSELQRLKEFEAG